MPQQSVLFSEVSNRQVVITDNFNKNKASVFERLGTRPLQSAIELKSGERRSAQIKTSKPPNCIRMNSTLKLFRPSVTSSTKSYPVQSKVSYSEVVKGNASITIALTAIAKSTLKSTTDMRPAANAPSGSTSKRVNQDPQIPFKLIPVVPPQKSDTIKYVKTDAKTSSECKSVSKRVKSKIKRRSLSSVQEDVYISINNRGSQLTKYTLSSQQSTDFEMIDANTHRICGSISHCARQREQSILSC